MRVLATLLIGAFLGIPAGAQAQAPLEACADQFIGGTVANAPTTSGSSSGRPLGSNRHLCYRDDGTSFFATEYWVEQFAPRWAAYRLSPENYGKDGCRTYTRAKANCYIQEGTWSQFQACTKGSDPFHPDHMLVGAKLKESDFGSTGHDRGHIAPRQAFSWHVCGTYQTFSMANMSPQRAFLNQDIWQFLEQQVLTWAVDEGPIYVVTGTVFQAFPHESFEVYANKTFDAEQIYTPNFSMLEAVKRHKANFDGHQKGHIVKPKRSANPDKVPSTVKAVRLPTGYYKVIYRPAVGTEPAHAIGFLLPHTFENLNSVPGLAENDAFWAFVARIDLIEQVAETRFPGIPEQMKRGWGDRFFLSRNTGRDIRASSCGDGSPQGVLPNSTKDQRLSACIDHLKQQ